MNMQMNESPESIPKGNNDLNFTEQKREFFEGFGGLSREEVKEIAQTEKVGSWEVDKFTLEEIQLMEAGAYTGRENEIPNGEELFKIAKILRARKVIEQ